MINWFDGNSTTFWLMAASVMAFLVSSMMACGKKNSGGRTGDKNAANNPKVKQPKVWPKNEKEQKIAKGELKKGRNDYPTMDDVVSDWSSEEEEEDGKKKKPKEKKKKPTKEEGKSKSKSPSAAKPHNSKE
ncbi:unnamed protein product [Bursaphelenchus xylophilus]|uniref:(pine wood nematode) hypothetical protein n=1 Tax=Bursaphelenchus xylophilus TaxID=6326 RepID=A0A1I7S541_BURXY|nr:unnamed protein product [Bursaphelenchus xylophilus]CAG9117679.1 unnamed protein product [Bursaphelenchus xylophilus]